MADVTCPCGARFDAASPRAVYCSAKCRKRGSRAGLVAVRPAPVSTMPAPPTPPVPAADGSGLGSVVAAVVAELRDANALTSAEGLAAVKLAELIDYATPMQGSSVAAWTREMRAALASAKQTAPVSEEDPIDDLERRRASRRGA